MQEKYKSRNGAEAQSLRILPAIMANCTGLSSMFKRVVPLCKIMSVFLFSLFATGGWAQLSDSFSDGELSNNPTWRGDNSKFIVSTGKLKLQAPAVSETAFLSTPSQAIYNGSWEAYLQMDFNPSSTNYAKIYLVSDQPNLSGVLNGYFVKAGNTAREISLYRQNGSIETKIIDGMDDRINFTIVKVKIKVTRNTGGSWQLFSDVGPSGHYVLEGTFIDVTNTNSSYFGIHCTYTATRSDKFWFDDLIVTGTTAPDIAPPTIQTVTTLSRQQVRVLFSEPVEQTTAQTGNNFLVENLGSAASAVLQPDQKTIVLNFSTSLINGVTYALQISGVKDLAGNIMITTRVNILFFQAVASMNKDIVITELFPDPTPQIGLPSVEFIEIYNRTQNPFNLAGWKLSDGSSTGIFPSQIILPGEYWIVTAAASLNFFVGWGKTIGLTNFPTLNNAADMITLKNGDHLTIDSINYDIGWYRDADKQEGGWTLELIDPGNPCGEADNWTASENPKGGTPGYKNSVFANKPDLTEPKLLSVFPESPTRLALVFDEKLDPTSVSLENFIIQPTIDISKAFFNDISLKAIKLDVYQDLVTRKVYVLDAKNIRDCNSNRMTPASLNFGLSEKADSLDVVVNEILFNPRVGGVDFVEVFNSSPKFLNLKNWKIGNYIDGVPTNISVLFTKDILLYPHGFTVFTTDPLIVKSQYPPSIVENIFKAPIPGLQDDKGSVVIQDDAGKIMDEVTYSKEWHSIFIKKDEGVSLERIDATILTNNKANWTSAGAAAGFATPGFSNSHFRAESEIDEGDVSIVPEIFSPNGGSNDFIQIQYRFDKGGWVANVRVYDQQERLQKTITNNETLGTEGFFRWDGDRDDGSKSRNGYYVVQFEVFNAFGSVKTFLKRVVVASR